MTEIETDQDLDRDEDTGDSEDSSSSDSSSSDSSGDADELVSAHVSDTKKCPECDEPVDNLRAQCPKCGREYEDSDYDEPDAGDEFKAGAALDESGEEDPDWDPGPDPQDKGGNDDEHEAPEGTGGGEAEEV